MYLNGLMHFPSEKLELNAFSLFSLYETRKNGLE